MCDLTKPLFQCTLGDFAEAIAQVLQRDIPRPDNQADDFSTYPKGISGLCRIFGCSTYRARQILQSGAINDAIIRMGARTFVTNPTEAKKLYRPKN